MTAWAVAMMLVFGTPEAGYVARARAGIDVMCSCSRQAAEPSPDAEAWHSRSGGRGNGPWEWVTGVDRRVGWNEALDHPTEAHLKIGERVSAGRVASGDSAVQHPPILPHLCTARHALAAWTIGVIAALDADPDEALALLVGLGAHETRFAGVVQIGGGPAVTWWQLEPTAWTRTGRAAQAAVWLSDPVLAAMVALQRARGDRGRLVQYAGGSEAVAAELRAYVDRARQATR